MKKLKGKAFQDRLIFFFKNSFAFFFFNFLHCFIDLQEDGHPRTCSISKIRGRYSMLGRQEGVSWISISVFSQIDGQPQAKHGLPQSEEGVGGGEDRGVEVDGTEIERVEAEEGGDMVRLSKGDC